VKLLWQGYGMTEVYTHPMPRRMEPDVPYDTIGRPVSWMEFGVVDEHDILLPPDEVGELVFRPTLPHAMAHGYYKAPEATAEVYRGLMFHTGDLAYYDEEGRVHYKGRRGDRIRRRGENVSAMELEFVAMGHERVVEAAAYGVPGEFGEHEVKLDVVLQGDLELHELHAWLETKLPRFMVPRYLERLDEFPKTPSMKIEKYRLAERPLTRPSVATFDAPRR
jgi:crotonobetaine/carnitine-CoA ligase